MYDDNASSLHDPDALLIAPPPLPSSCSRWSGSYGTQHRNSLVLQHTAQEKATAGSLLAKYDWYVIRKAEASKAIPTAIKTYRTAVRTACATRETEIDNCADTAALVTLYGSTEKDGVYSPNMTQYPEDPNV